MLPALLALSLTAAPVTVGPVPKELRERLHLSAHYTKAVDAGGLPILGSDKTADAALREARYLVLAMLSSKPKLLKAMSEQKVRLAVMAPTELTTDIPEHSDLTPKDFWDRRARGLGATAARPAVSCAEENLLGEPGDPYSTENICIHEFAHAIHEMALAKVDPGFDARLTKAYDAARKAGTWAGTYAMTNKGEYWAEAAQSWFDTNRENDADHGAINTRDELRKADPEVAKLLEEVFGDEKWRYTKPETRGVAERAELGAFPNPPPKFAWPKQLQKPIARELTEVQLSPIRAPLPMSAKTSASVRLLIENAGGEPLQLEWVDFDGALKPYGVIAPGERREQQTFAGHVWRLSRGKAVLGLITAPSSDARVKVSSGQ